MKVDHTISCDYQLCSLVIDFDRFQSTGIGNTTLTNLANLTETEGSCSSLCLLNAEGSKNTQSDENKIPIYFTF